MIVFDRSDFWFDFEIILKYQEKLYQFSIYTIHHHCNIHHKITII